MENQTIKNLKAYTKVCLYVALVFSCAMGCAFYAFTELVQGFIP